MIRRWEWSGSVVQKDMEKMTYTKLLIVLPSLGVSATYRIHRTLKHMGNASPGQRMWLSLMVSLLLCGDLCLIVAVVGR